MKYVKSPSVNCIGSSDSSSAAMVGTAKMITHNTPEASTAADQFMDGASVREIKRFPSVFTDHESAIPRTIRAVMMG